MFLWGEQMGWFDPNILNLESPEAKYLKILCKALDKEAVKKFLFYGEMVRPPKLEGDNPILSAAWNENQKDTEMPAVSHSAWKARMVLWDWYSPTWITQPTPLATMWILNNTNYPKAKSIV